MATDLHYRFDMVICAEIPATVSGLRSTSVGVKSQSILSRCPELQRQLIRNGAICMQKSQHNKLSELQQKPMRSRGCLLAWSTWSFSRVLSISSFSLHGGCGMSTAPVLLTQLKQKEQNNAPLERQPQLQNLFTLCCNSLTHSMR